jgi:hypothetical protein
LLGDHANRTNVLTCKRVGTKSKLTRFTCLFLLHDICALTFGAQRKLWDAGRYIYISQIAAGYAVFPKPPPDVPPHRLPPPTHPKPISTHADSQDSQEALATGEANAMHLDVNGKAET